MIQEFDCLFHLNFVENIKNRENLKHGRYETLLISFVDIIDFKIKILFESFIL